ncbi:MAG: hypothetical protein QOC77_3886 [Thermoleophilaceae bacterium]|nr:hypothetical protein [Thermoleophilaceae bacterium]
MAACVSAVVALGCGSSSSPSSTAAGTSGSSGTSSSAGARSLSAEALSKATGDIPDNQVFLHFTNTSAGYSIKYPEGWTQSGSGSDVTFRDKNNIVHIVTGGGSQPPTAATVTAELKALKRSDPTLAFNTPRTIALGSTRAIKLTYRTRSSPDPVTGKSVLLIVDRYELAGPGRRATVDLGTPRGVDNVDAYRMMIQSFRWR